ncbi:heterogeneous nuclear ribonucleoprotein Q-like [Apium graveolens]|uniref:heterogeneous nuclear ribonucleoprotein Q-like n=1 Tax=Apium graveolens TaxID=4045 RepID=UPI003D7A3A23
MKAETIIGGTIVRGEMGALERQRRRKTEIIVGGLDKDTKEEDIRNIFEVVKVLGEIKDVTLVNSSKTKNAFAFVRFALAADAKKALMKYRKVEICGKLCGTSPVEGSDTLFLGKIDKRWKSNDVTELLQGIGIEKIDHVTVMPDPNNIELNRGFAFLELESNKDAQNAYKKLQKRGVFGKHSHIKVDWAEPLIELDESKLNKVKSIYVEHLPSSWDEQKVKYCFKRFGDIETVVLARDMPSSRRKDFAFVNYTTRDAALACVEAFSSEQINDEGSKVKVKVSLAKPLQKSQQIKHLRTPPTKEFKEKQKGTPLVKQGSRITRNPTSCNYETRIVDQRSSMASELVQLLREQASVRPTIYSLNAGLPHYNPTLTGIMSSSAYAPAFNTLGLAFKTTKGAPGPGPGFVDIEGGAESSAPQNVPDPGNEPRDFEPVIQEIPDDDDPLERRGRAFMVSLPGARLLFPGGLLAIRREGARTGCR